jgi:release factor glutamine methyltransferase
MTFLDSAQQAAGVLRTAGHPHEDARRDVSVLACHVLGWDAARWLTDRHGQAPAGFHAQLMALVARRLRHEPVAYLTGTREFYGRAFLVTPAVLVPRPETEGLVEVALECLAERQASRCDAAPPLVVDVGTGSGCVAITLAIERPDIRLVATDISTRALDVAAANAMRQGVATRIEFREVSLSGGLTDAVDVIVSNPPYVAERDRPTLAPDVADFEPSTALFGGEDGLDVIRALVADAGRALVPGGWLAMEIGHDQATGVEALVRRQGLVWVGVRPDLAGHPRIAIARRAARSV